MLAVSALLIAAALLVWVLYSAGGSGTSTAGPAGTPTPPGSSGTTASTGGSTKGGKSSAPVPWNEVRVTVLNGTLTANFAAQAKTTLQAAGWHILSTGNAGPLFPTTEVVYPPDKAQAAHTVATKLGLTAVPESEITGLTTTAPLTTVAIVLGTNGLPPAV